MLQVEAHPVVAAADFDALLSFIDRRVADGRRVRNGTVRAALLARYRRQPPAVRHGVAIPHAAVRQLQRTRLIYAGHGAGIVLGQDVGNPLRESITLLVRYPATAADHGLLSQLELAAMQARLLPLFRAGDTEGVVDTLAAMVSTDQARYADGPLAAVPTDP